MMTSEARQSEATPFSSLALKVLALRNPQIYAHAATDLVCRETHMSYIFLAGEFAYKLKKPVRYAYLDFSTLPLRRKACVAEVELNRRLAPDVYLGVLPLVDTSTGLRIGGEGEILDWLVQMRRLDEGCTLENALQDGSVTTTDLDRVACLLRDFYKRAKRVRLNGAAHVAFWRRSLMDNRCLLVEPALGLPRGLVHYVCSVQQRFLREAGGQLASRAQSGNIVDGHGDLRPEHIWLTDPVRVIDCLEFNASLRAVDPLDELAFLSVECERMGHPEASERFQRKLGAPLQGAAQTSLYVFYRCHRATLRARLAIAHLLEPNPRTPDKWPRLARSYLGLAFRDARKLERCLGQQAGCDASRRDFQSGPIMALPMGGGS
jgi:aminoglycoside phosphotransferase family enzyme